MDHTTHVFSDLLRSQHVSRMGQLVGRVGHILSAQERLRSLLAANHLVMDGLDLEQVLRHVVEAAVGLVDAQYGALGVMAPDGRVERVTHVGITRDLADQIGSLLEVRGLLGEFIDGDAPIRLDDLGADARSSKCPPQHPPTRSLLGVPIRVRGEPYGILYLANRTSGTFTQEDEQLVMALAATAGVAIGNTRLYEDTRRGRRDEVLEDRARIARDLHDHVIQRLSGTGLSLHALAAEDPAHADLIDAHITEIDDAIADIRTAVFALRTEDSSESSRHRLVGIATELAPALGFAPRMTFRGPVDLFLTGDLADDVAAVVRETLSNVARHAHSDAVLVDVSVAENGLTVTVDDDGDGLPPRPRRSSGTANLAERAGARGGGFTLEPRLPRGARARWRAPLAGEGGAPRTRVFLVDDHEVARRGIAQLIDTEPGMDVVGESSTVHGTLQRIGASMPDIVVLDVNLPDGSGIDLCRSIHSTHAGIRCLILTAYDDDETVGVAAVMAGAFGYVTKRIRGRDLLDGIHRVSCGESLIERELTERVHASIAERATARREPPVDLTLRERQALQLITEGLTNRQIGERLGIAEKTVKNYVSGLLAKLGMVRRTQVAAYGAAENARRAGSARTTSGTAEPDAGP